MDYKAFYEKLITRHEEAIVKDRAMLAKIRVWRKEAKAAGDSKYMAQLEEDRKWYYKQIRWEQKHINNFKYLIERYC